MGWFDSAVDWVSDNAGGILEGAGTVIDWLGSEDEKKAVEKQAEKQADEAKRVAEANKEISLYDAEVARRIGLQKKFEADAQAGLMYNNLQKLLAAQRTRYGKAGVALKAGSPVDVMEQTTIDAAKDIMNIKYKGQSAKASADSLAERYKLLADKGLRDAAAQASLIEDAAADTVEALKWKQYGTAVGDIYTLGKEYSWF